jgi:hypothetical protein
MTFRHPIAALDPEDLVYVCATAGTAIKRSQTPRWFYIFARASRIAGLGWWKGGASVTALLGDGDDAGILRLQPNGPHVIRNRMGRGRVPVLGLPAAFMTVLPGKQGPEATPFKVEVNPPALLLTLPSWAVDPALVPGRISPIR